TANLPAAAAVSYRLLHPAGVRPAGPQGPRLAGRRPPHEPDARAHRRRVGLRHGVVLAPSPGRAGPVGAGRLRPRGRGAAARLRDPRDRTTPGPGLLDPPGLDPRRSEEHTSALHSHTYLV